MRNIRAYKKRYKQLLSELPERARRLVAASDAKMLGYGGITFVHKASGISRVTITKGIKELEKEFLPHQIKIDNPGEAARGLCIVTKRF